MREREKLHARKDPRYKTIKNQVQKKFRAACWQYVEEIITPNRTPSMPPTELAIHRSIDLAIYRSMNLAIHRFSDQPI